MSISNKHVFHGMAGSLALSAVYFLILTLFNSFEHSLTQFAEMWYLLVPLIAGFGVQVGLYSFARAAFHAKAMEGTSSMAASGGISGGSMILCCLHHLTDVLPIIGFSAAALFLSQYQGFFIAIGIFSNIIGITMILNVIQKHDIVPKGISWGRIFSYNMKSVRNRTVILSAIVLLAVGIFMLFQPPGVQAGYTAAAPVANGNAPSSALSLGGRTNSENGVTIDVTPIDFSLGMPLAFDIKFTTHAGDLGFEVDKISFLEDDKGNKYLPSGWEGSPPGGHHRSGKLLFPPIPQGTISIQLTIKDVYEVPERTFFWQIG